jgi:hypothetical protein
VRAAIVLRLTLALPFLACGTESSDDDADELETGAGSTDGPGSDDSAGPGTTGDTPSEPTTAEPTEDDGDSTTESNDGDPPADSGSGSGGEPQPLPPAHGAELRPWLEAGEYLDWQAESGVHPSTGPHFGGVRTFVNDVLYDSLATGASSHPEGSAAIKELYGAGDTVLGWSVEIKLQSDSAGGDGWYWYEGYQGSVYADGTGDGGCTGCHGGGSDYVLTPFPLQ